MKLFVAAIPYDFDDVDLKEMFELYGEVSSAKIIMDRETGKSRGFGFVDMSDDNEAKIAIETLDGASIKGKKLSVKQAEDQPRSAGPGFGGRDRGDRGSRDGRDSRDNRGNFNRRDRNKPF